MTEHEHDVSCSFGNPRCPAFAEPTAHRPVGPGGVFQTGPHRTIREVLGDYRAAIREGLPYGWWRSPDTWAGLVAWAMLTGLLTALVCLYTMTP